MRTLAIDTSLAAGSVAAAAAGRTIEIELPVAGEHARRIVTALEEAVQHCGWKVGDVELVGVVRGPGSFTGLRVGLTTAKAIAWAAGAALVGVSGFELIARRTARVMIATPETLHLAYDAGRGELFVAEAMPAAEAPSGYELSAPRLVAAATWITGLPRRAIVSGPGLCHVGEPLAARADLRVAPAAAWQPMAADAADLATRLHAAGRSDAPAALVPHYLRPTYADESVPPPG